MDVLQSSSTILPKNIFGSEGVAEEMGKTDLKETFDAFCEIALKGNYSKEDETAVLKRIRDWVHEQRTPLTDPALLEDYLIYEKNNKSGAAEVLKRFYEYCEREGIETEESSLTDYILIDGNKYRSLEILRHLLAGVPNETIARTFCISERTLKRHIRELRKGITFYGTSVRITKKRGRNGGYELVGAKLPYMLLLDQEDLFLLTHGFQEHRSDPLFGHSAGKILGMIENHYQVKSDDGFSRMIDFNDETDEELQKLFVEKSYGEYMQVESAVSGLLREMILKGKRARVSASDGTLFIQDEECTFVHYELCAGMITLDFESHGILRLPVRSIGDVEILQTK